jgi:2-haloacid dehalogenase
LLFDVFGTVVDWRTSVAREAAAILPADLDGEAFADAWRDRYQPAMDEVRSGRRPWTILDVLHYENLQAVLQAFDVDELPAEQLAELNQAWHRLAPWPDTVAGLERLKRRYIIAPHSNGNICLLVNMAKRAGLPWDVILGAEVVRAYKPMPESYQRATAALGRAPDQCMMVAAHNGDLGAAQAQGLQTAFVARPREHGEQQTTDLTPSGDWTIVAKDFEDLAAQLGA